MADYFSQRHNYQNQKINPYNFWDTIKTFMTNKSKNYNENITLKHEGKIINLNVCDIFNGYFTNVAQEN